uniref:MCM C-terminal AAA(+) ATPase domain-containing protein n=1 Tax=Compsopogon caeruleus TaxID=31354 RepID=A0A6T6B886_9RHOD|mmetsp:Transcript_13583/g.27805  ORF Transcript_13583/g.27805 Transcript_13583/m.27805 type:complete len:399 (+) Transcript_13583:2122-3318(+)
MFSTLTGLTVTAARDATTGEWTLDAGALVLADGGLCCIDEFDGIREGDRATIHEAMEQQTISVAKAGLVCVLDTRATVIAAMNPKPLRSQISAVQEEGQLSFLRGLASPLLSRFDVILNLHDPCNEEWDRQLSSFVLHSRSLPEGFLPTFGVDIWNIEELKKYIFYVKSRFQPSLSEEAELILSQYYAGERAGAERNAARTTVRLFESLIRLSQAHARLMFRDIAVVQDAIFAIAAVESSLMADKVLDPHSQQEIDSDVDPDQQYIQLARQVLTRLDLEGKIDLFQSGERTTAVVDHEGPSVPCHEDFVEGRDIDSDSDHSSPSPAHKNSRQISSFTRNGHAILQSFSRQPKHTDKEKSENPENGDPWAMLGQEGDGEVDIGSWAASFSTRQEGGGSS